MEENKKIQEIAEAFPPKTQRKHPLQMLKLNKEFKHAYYQGKSKAGPYFIFYRVRSRYPGVRFGITTSKKVGNAVCRNRARRLIRAAVRSVQPKFEGGWDYVFVARDKILSAKSYQVAAAMKGCLKEFKDGKIGTRPPKRTNTNG